MKQKVYPMEKDTKLSHNLAAQFIYQLSLYLIPFISTPYLSRVLGSSMIGRFSYARSIASYFVLAAGFGSATYGQRLIASLKLDPDAQKQALFDLVGLRFITAGLGGTVYLAAVVPASVDPGVSFFVGLEILSVAVDISWYYQGCERFSVIAVSNGITKLAMTLLLFAFVRKPTDVWIYAAIYGSSTLVCGFLQWRAIPGRRLTRESPDVPWLQRERSHITGALALFAAQLAMQIYTVLDKTMIGVITGSEAENGYYDQAQRLIRLLESCCTVVSPVIASRIAVLWSQKKREEALRLLNQSMRFVCCLGVPLAVGIQLIVADFVPLYYGPSYEPVILLLRGLAFLPLIIGMSNVIGIQFLVPTGQERRLTISVTIGAAVNAVLNMILIYALQSFGAVIASAIAEITVTAVQLYYVRSLLHTAEMLKMVCHYVAASMPMLLCGLLLQAALRGPVLRLAVTIPACGAVYLVCLFLTKDPFIQLAADIWKNRGGNLKTK